MRRLVSLLLVCCLAAGLFCSCGIFGTGEENAPSSAPSSAPPASDSVSPLPNAGTDEGTDEGTETAAPTPEPASTPAASARSAAAAAPTASPAAPKTRSGGADTQPAPGPQATPEPQLVNLAAGLTGFTVEMSGPGNDLDPGTGDVTIREKEPTILSRLTDGLYGNGAILDGAWNGSGARSRYYEAYRNIDRTITLDLGGERSIREISMHVQEHPQYGISAPANFTYYLSEDGVQFSRVGRVSRFEARVDTDPAHSEGDDQNAIVNYEFTLTGLRYNARYVRVVFELTGTWAFMDEMTVNGSPAPDTGAAPLPDTSGGSSEAVNAYAGVEQSGGIQHESLVYAGYSQYESDQAFTTTERTVEKLLPVIAYLDPDGTIAGPFFQSVTFLPHLTLPDLTTQDPTDGRYVVYSVTEMAGDPNAAALCARITEWQTWLDFLFDFRDEDGQPCNLDALELAAGKVKEALGDPDYQVSVKISVLPAILCQDDFGALPGTQRSLNFAVSDDNPKEQALADRLAAIRWYVDTVRQRFAQKGYENIRLDGFYWHHEAIDYDVDPLAAEYVQAAVAYIHSLDPDYKVYWIPSYQAPGFREWKELGFDYAIMQPNYAFDANATTQRIDDCADLCKKYGLGLEMEFGGIADDFIAKFREYLIRGQQEGKGYQQESLIAWYTSTDGIFQTSRDESGTRYIYEAMYDFFRGTETDMESPQVNLAGKGSLSLSAQTTTGAAADLSPLTDGQTGNWNAGCLQLNKNQFGGTITLTADLNGVSDLSGVALYTIDQPDWGIAAPAQVAFSFSANGQTWTPLETITAEQAESRVSSAGFGQRIFRTAAPAAARYVRAEFTYAPTGDGDVYTHLGVDELLVEGSAPVAQPESLAAFATLSLTADGVLNPEEFALQAQKAAGLLKDGGMQTGGWPGEYVTLSAGTAEGPYTIEAAFPGGAAVEALGVDMLRRESWGIGCADEVLYQYRQEGSESWTDAGIVTAAQAEQKALGSEGDAACLYMLQLPAGVRVTAVRAVFQRGTVPESAGPVEEGERWAWIGLDEFVIRGSL